MVRKSQPPALVGQLSRLGRPSGWTLNRLEPSAQEVVDGIGAGRFAEAKSLGELLEQPRLGRPDVEVAAEDQRRIGGPGDGRLGSMAYLRLRPGGAGARVQVRHAEPRAEPGEGHRPSLGAAAQHELSMVEEAPLIRAS